MKAVRWSWRFGDSVILNLGYVNSRDNSLSSLDLYRILYRIYPAVGVSKPIYNPTSHRWRARSRLLARAVDYYVQYIPRAIPGSLNIGVSYVVGLDHGSSMHKWYTCF